MSFADVPVELFPSSEDVPATSSPVNVTLYYIDSATTSEADDRPDVVQLLVSQWSVAVNGYISPVLILFTLVTNSFVCAVLLRPGMRTPTNVLLVAMAVSDTLTGLSPLPTYLYFYTSGHHDEWVPYRWCYVYFCLIEHLPTVFHTASVWLTVSLGVHRYICVCRSPETRRRTSTTGSAVSIVAVIYCVTIVSHACRFFDSTYDPILVPSRASMVAREANASTGADAISDGVNETDLVLGCQPHFVPWVKSHEQVYFNVYYWFRVVFIHLVPCSTLVTVNAALVRAMRAASRRRKQLLSFGSATAHHSTAQQPTHHQRRKSECRRLADSNVTTAMLVAVVGVFLLVEFPLAVLFIIVIVQNSFQIHLIDSDDGETATMFINLIILFSYSTNFFIYCGMSAQFRSTLIAMLTGGGGNGRRGNGGRGERMTVGREHTTFVGGAVGGDGEVKAGLSPAIGSRCHTQAPYIALTVDVDGNGIENTPIAVQRHVNVNGMHPAAEASADYHVELIENSERSLLTSETLL